MKKLSIFLAALLLASCSEDDNTTPAVNLCALPLPSAQSTNDISNPCAIAVSPSGMIAVSAYNGGYGAAADIKIYTSLQNFQSGTVKATLNAIAPEAMVFDADDNLYVAETEQIAGIKVYDHIGDGAFSFKKTIQDDFSNPRGLAFDSEGRLFLADDGTGRIIRFDDPFNSNAHVTIGNWDVGVKGIAIQDNVMYVTNYVTGSVSRNTLKADGSFEELTHAINFEKATDVSFSGKRVIVTSYETGKVAVCSECAFGDENKVTYDNLGKIFGTAFANNGLLLAATYDLDKVTQILLF